jgi:VanZ family protein
VLLATVLVGASLSAGFEAVQVFIPGRTSSIYDVIANTAGTLCGALAFLWNELLGHTRDSLSGGFS